MFSLVNKRKFLRKRKFIIFLQLSLLLSEPNTMLLSHIFSVSISKETLFYSHSTFPVHFFHILSSSTCLYIFLILILASFLLYFLSPILSTVFLNHFFLFSYSTISLHILIVFYVYFVIWSLFSRFLLHVLAHFLILPSLSVMPLFVSL